MTDLTRQQLCAALGISESHVKRLENMGLPYTPVGIRSKRYDLAECKAFLRGNECQFTKTKAVVGTPRLWSTENALIERSQKMRVRVTPSALNPN
jgi:hypothetical protein